MFFQLSSYAITLILTVATLDLPKSTDESIILYIWVILDPSLLVHIKISVEKTGIYFVIILYYFKNETELQ